MKTLITGGSGFIGSHLAAALLDLGHDVNVIDDLSTGNITNIEPLIQHPTFHFTLGSVMDESVIGELVDRSDIIFHLAAAVGVKLVVENPVRTIQTNVDCTAVILEQAAAKGKKVVLASTSEVYGKSPNVPFGEDDDLIIGSTDKNRWSYACSKAIDEFMAFAYLQEYQLPVVILRLFNTVGPRQTGRYGMVIPRFVKQALEGAPLTIYGDGSQTRCFAHVSDVVEGIIALAMHPRAVGQVFNIGNNEEVTIEALARKVINLTHSSSELAYIPYEHVYGVDFEDMQRRVPDLTKIRSLIGYQPKKDSTAIIESVIDYFRSGSG